MALPVGVSTCEVTVGTAVDWFGRDASIEARCIPSAYAVWAATGQPVLPFTQSLSTGAGASLSFIVPHVDQPGFVDGSGAAFTMWAYRFVVTFGGAGKQEIQKWLQPVVGQTQIDLDLVPDGGPTDPVETPTAAVLSVNGTTGAVAVSLVEDPPASGLYELVVE